MKTVIALSAVIVSVLALVSPCYSIAASQASNVLYTLPSPVILQGLNTPCNANGSCPAMFLSNAFTLQSGSTIDVYVIQSQTCFLIIVGYGGSNGIKLLPTSDDGLITGSGQGIFVAPQTGQYEAFIQNISNAPQRVGSLTIYLAT